MTPANGWKAYYAATRAIVNINAEFFNIIKERSIQAMSHFWRNADYVKCVHASGELFSGYDVLDLLTETWFLYPYDALFFLREYMVSYMCLC